METFALRLAAKQGRSSNETSPLTNRESFPSVAAYRAYADDVENEGTFVSTSQTGVTRAPQTFFGHTISFLTAKSNLQEVETLKESLEKEFGPHVAQYAFPHAEREQAATSHWRGYVQQITSQTLASALNPALRGIKMDASLLENAAGPSPARPFVERQLNTVIQSTVREINPTLRNINLNLSLPTETPSIGLSHRLIKQVLEKADTLLADAPYIAKAAKAVGAIADQLGAIDEDLIPPSKEVITLTTIITGLADDITEHHPTLAQTTSPRQEELSELLEKTTTAIPQTLHTAHSIILETRAIAAVLKGLKQKHNNFEFGSSAPISLEAYNFEQFVEPITALLQEERALANTLVRDICTPITSNGKRPKLETHLQQNERISRALKKYSDQVSQLKQKLMRELDTLASRSQNRINTATDAIEHPTILRSLYQTVALKGNSWEEERDSAQEDLDFAITTKVLITSATEPTQTESTRKEPTSPTSIAGRTTTAMATDRIPLATATRIPTAIVISQNASAQ
ncbi:MAG: hypothetical protein FJ390_07355 [Verrucomicrobia bacterium]|nr:hypothetical protein [Verrucomicrobiota bacterium]